MVFTTSCNYNCWECSQTCELIQLFRLPEPVFYKVILDSLKARAGMLITQGYDRQWVDQDLMKSAVALKLARELFLEKHHF